MIIEFQIFDWFVDVHKIVLIFCIQAYLRQHFITYEISTRIYVCIYVRIHSYVSVVNDVRSKKYIFSFISPEFLSLIIDPMSSLPVSTSCSVWSDISYGSQFCLERANLLFQVQVKIKHDILSNIDDISRSLPFAITTFLFKFLFHHIIDSLVSTRGIIKLILLRPWT